MDLILTNNFPHQPARNDKTILQDVLDFVRWETNQGEYPFSPQTSDDVAIRTYLLDCRIRGMQPLYSKQDSLPPWSISMPGSKPMDGLQKALSINST